MLKYIVSGMLLCSAANLSAANNLDGNDWFTKARFGIFVHWGMFTGGGSSTTGSRNLPYYKTNLRRAASYRCRKLAEKVQKKRPGHIIRDL